MANIENDWVVAEKKMEDKLTVITTRDTDLTELKQKEPLNLIEGKKKEEAPLKEDPLLQPLAKKDQTRRIVFFDQVGFLKDIEAKNKEARRQNRSTRAEKGFLFGDLAKLQGSKVVLSNGRTQKLPSDLRDIISKLDKYLFMSVSARDFASSFIGVTTRGVIKDEHTALATLNRRLPELIAKYGEQDGYRDIVKRLTKVRNTLLVQSGRVLGGNTQEERMKAKWKGFDPAKSRHIVALNKKLESTADSKDKDTSRVEVKDRKDWPLFAHRPTYDDVSQGYAGNCFFLAAVASLPAQKIREMMLDHGDGTVTVRFYERDPETEKRRPVYITVDKKVNIASAFDCLWVQVMEKAYAQFRQDQAKNKMSFTKRKVKDPATKKQKLAPEKTIAEDVIDLGYVGNGGQSHAVLGDLLGTEETKIHVYRSTKKKTRSQIFMEALQHSDKKGTGFLEIQKLKDRLEDKQVRLKAVLDGKRIDIDEVKTVKDEIADARTVIQRLKDALSTAKTEQEKETYNKRIKEHEKNIASLQKNIAPIKGILYDYWDEEEKIEKSIKELRIKYDIPEQKHVEGEGGQRFQENDEGRFEMAEAEIFGMEEELKAAEEKVRTINASHGEQFLGVVLPTARIKIQSFLTTYLDDMARLHAKVFKDNSISSYKAFLNIAMESARKKDKTFVEKAKETQVHFVMENNEEAAVDTLSAFVIPLIEKMIANLHQVDEVGMEEEYGQEDVHAIGYFNQLTEMLRAGQKICIGTRELTAEEGSGAAGEGMAKGMVGRHAYTVLDTDVTKSGARIIKLRNPWARYVAAYQNKKSGGLEAYSIKREDTNGVFWIELNHFMQHVSSIFSSGVLENE